MTPPWMFEDAKHKPLSRERALEDLKSHIETVVKHFKGKLSSWDVVNEAISDKRGEYLVATKGHEGAQRGLTADHAEYAEGRWG